MRRITEARALSRLRQIKENFRIYLSRFSHKANDCALCPNPCCINPDFVNVNISRLEAIAIVGTLIRSPRVDAAKLQQVIERVDDAVIRYRLSDHGDTFRQKYSCPLFEPGRGCMVHYKAKPTPCIQFDCYDDWRDEPDLSEFYRTQRRVEQLHRAVGEEPVYYTIPFWLAQFKEQLTMAVAAKAKAASEQVEHLAITAPNTVIQDATVYFEV